MPWQKSERWLLVRETCDANPGVWVKITNKGHISWPRHIATGRLRAFEPGLYEGKMRGGNGVRGPIYVRKIPEEELA